MRQSRSVSLVQIFDKVRRPYLILDTDREYLAWLYRQLGYKVGAEIGVGGGTFSELICLANPGVKLYCIDTWRPYKGYEDFTDAEYLERDYKRAVEVLAPFDTHLIRKFSMAAVKDFADGSLDFVYIDANHRNPHITNDLHHWARKVRPGGLVSGHDYVPIHNDVIEAVDDYVNDHHCRPLFLVGIPQENGTDTMNICSWFFVKE